LNTKKRFKGGERVAGGGGGESDFRGRKKEGAITGQNKLDGKKRGWVPRIEKKSEKKKLPAQQTKMHRSKGTSARRRIHREVAGKKKKEKKLKKWGENSNRKPN